VTNGEVLKGQLALYAHNAGKLYGGNVAATAIAWTLANRVRSGMGTWEQVLNSAGQYEQNGEVVSHDLPNIWDAGFLAICQGIDDVYSGRGRDLSCGALFYCDTAKPMNEFFAENVLRNPGLQRCMQHNSLIFYSPREQGQSF
jgi:hypothetical protein